MRPAAPLALAAVVLVFSPLLGAAPTRRPTPPPQPPADEATTESGVAVLRTPGPAQILFRAGTFTMGSSDEEIAEVRKICESEPRREDCREEIFAAEQAQHEVYLSDYWLDRTEVTVARYRRCVAAGACAMPPYAEGGERFDQPPLPVVLVTWNDARRFCAWAGGRLPTEAEWERAARGAGPNGRRYPWGNVYNPFLANHGAMGLEDLDARDGFLELAPAGSFPDGRTPEGLDDMAGNAQEWVADWYAPEYPKADASNPKGPDIGEMRVVRGGSYAHPRLWLRGAARDREPPNERAPWIGFRCARDATPA
jgi:formylglycine-generating enzyme required for sulfatase activity